MTRGNDASISWRNVAVLLGVSIIYLTLVGLFFDHILFLLASFVCAVSATVARKGGYFGREGIFTWWILLVAARIIWGIWGASWTLPLPFSPPPGFAVGTLGDTALGVAMFAFMYLWERYAERLIERRRGKAV